MDGIRVKHRLSSSLRDRAHLVIDTSNVTADQSKRLSTWQFAGEPGGVRVFITSFSYRHGISRDTNLIFDVCLLDNLRYRPELRSLTGLDGAMRRYIKADPGLAAFSYRPPPVARAASAAPRKRGKIDLTIGIGCTDGRHRSVHVSERLAEQLRAAGAPMALSHCDLPPFGPPGPVPFVALMAAS